LIYLDNAATSWPKPSGVQKAMIEFMDAIGANPGRSGHRLSVDAARIVFEAREKLAVLFSASDPSRIIFASNATGALNLALRGFLEQGNNVLATGMEHNSMMRTLNDLEPRGISCTIIPTSDRGVCDPQSISKFIARDTVLIVVNHGSNVNGTVQDIRAMGKIAREHGITLLVDAAQTAGILDIDVVRDNIDMLVFTGHKALFGPQGTGGLVLGPELDHSRLKPVLTGGTGSRSESERQPEFLPDKFESGTPNTVGIAGLSAGIDFINSIGLNAIRRRESEHSEFLRSSLEKIDRVKVLQPGGAENPLATVSIVIDGKSPAEAGLALDDAYSIMCRVGLHCSPLSHKTLGTFPEGTVRLSPGYFTSRDELIRTIEAVREISSHS
jgi:cysteine desulfurase / selenocysteine lyase